MSSKGKTHRRQFEMPPKFYDEDAAPDYRDLPPYREAKAAVSKLLPKLTKRTGFVTYGRLSAELTEEHKRHLSTVLGELDGVRWNDSVTPSRVWVEKGGQ